MVCCYALSSQPQSKPVKRRSIKHPFVVESFALTQLLASASVLLLLAMLLLLLLPSRISLLLLFKTARPAVTYPLETSVLAILMVMLRQ